MTSCGCNHVLPFSSLAVLRVCLQCVIGAFPGYFHLQFVFLCWLRPQEYRKISIFIMIGVERAAARYSIHKVFCFMPTLAFQIKKNP